MGARRRIAFVDRAALLAQQRYLAHGGILVEIDPPLPRGSECELELVGPDGRSVEVSALAAWVAEPATYFAFRDPSPAAQAVITGWTNVSDAEAPQGPELGEVPEETEPSDDLIDLGLDDEADHPDIDCEAGDAGSEEERLDADDADADADADADDDDDDDDADADDADLAAGTPGDRPDSPRAARKRRFSLNVSERMRGLTMVQQLKYARTGELAERTALERLYGKVVWEALLRNPRLSPPEVAHLARMGAMPRPLMELMVSNAGWLQSPQIRRALLGNPRLGPEQIDRVLRHIPKSELKLIVSQTVYPHPVRQAAKKMLHPGGG